MKSNAEAEDKKMHSAEAEQSIPLHFWKLLKCQVSELLRKSKLIFLMGLFLSIKKNKENPYTFIMALKMNILISIIYKKYIKTKGADEWG